MEYRELPPATRADLAEAQLSDGELTAHLLLGLVHIDPDVEWMQQRCLELLTHESDTVRGAAVLAFGHLARIHGTIDRNTVLPALERLRVEEPDLSGRIDDALDDIEMFA